VSEQQFTVGYQDGWITITSTVDGDAKVARFAAGSQTKETADARAQMFRQAYPQLRQWAVDAAGVNTNWPTMTQQQKDTALRETIRRLGLFFDNFAELLASLNADV